MRVLLLSTYELGAQPLGIALPAALLRREGHDLRPCDLSLEPLADEDVAWAEAALVSVPMHTALRLAVPVVARLRAGSVPVALHGLYAPVGSAAGMLGSRDLAVAGESGDALLEWLGSLGAGLPGAGSVAPGSPRSGLPGTSAVAPGSPAPAGGPAVRVELGPPVASTLVPERDGLPGLDRYARFVGGPAGEGERLVGTIEATSGCSHRCRHCPVPVIYGGRTRTVELAALLSDIDRLVELGAGHLHFADPDFLNRPAHSLAVVRALHDRHPQLSYDATVKVSHVLRHRALWPELAATGCAFVISAVESLSPLVLERLDKGHSPGEARRAVELLRAAGIEPRPSLLPFTPWSERDDLVELLDFAAEFDLVWNLDPVQWGIRLLLPPGSLLLERPDPVLAAALAAGAGDGAAAGDEMAQALGRRWAHADPLLDELALALGELVEKAAAVMEPLPETYAAVRGVVFDALGRGDRGVPEPRAAARSAVPGPLRARLTEAWFCCAEPTGAQLARTVSPCAIPAPPAGAPTCASATSGNG